jgi:hypothetical protein
VPAGTGVWPADAARLTAAHTTAVWLTADEQVLSDRIRRPSRYDDMPAESRHLTDRRYLGTTARVIEQVIACS